MFALTTMQLTQFKLLRCNNWLSSNDLLTAIIKFVCVNPFLIQMQKFFDDFTGIGLHIDISCNANDQSKYSDYRIFN